ncbi:tyrosine--tRNA ligase [Candidatus Falkowbacteria bacterium]|uniref:Tyrosine--tRNA ligase n=1 Tax=Candidatus Buchananbacteria bacterium CG10_big_fil_rev_8_21_14_0_10_33_19 TaxID=1974525 RepID=A0A2H0W536_9BACT|nr:tyrosine--tRNA ligase [Candidatus Falkowbacteria bacterium]PIS06456.1 MAG: tyrosine--tRNA ligase [Candidatus Buchananbacteria bacterium CG10_big_fil_rev_8_21_14_0_10_33_19]
MSKIITDENKIEAVLSRGVENIYPKKDDLKKLLMSGKEITLYCGYDPNSPTLHIGHGITIRKLAEFQKLGHKVIFLFGDFTGQIGDPDKLSVRTQIDHKTVLNNLNGWKDQIKNLIDIKKVDFRFNSKWLAKLDFQDLINIAQHFTAQQMLDRAMFQERIKSERPVYLHEFFYPLMQAYDSVAMNVDLEIGGNDQTFNMLAGRTLMRAMKNQEKLVLTTKLLEDPTGKKMGKSEGNMITLLDSAIDMYGKIMSWSDEMILPAFEILTDISDETLAEIKLALQVNKINPRDLKMQLAREVVKIYKNDQLAHEAEDEFKRVFQEGQKPQEIPEINITDHDDKIGVLDLFVKSGLAKSNSEVRRLIKEGAIKIDDDKIVSEELEIHIPEEGLLLQRGKKQFAKVFGK